MRALPTAQSPRGTEEMYHGRAEVVCGDMGLCTAKRSDYDFLLCDAEWRVTPVYRWAI